MTSSQCKEDILQVGGCQVKYLDLCPVDMLSDNYLTLPHETSRFISLPICYLE